MIIEQLMFGDDFMNNKNRQPQMINSPNPISRKELNK